MNMDTTYVLIGIAAFGLLVVAQFPLARFLATRNNWKKVNILFGVAQYIFWDKNEAVVLTQAGKEEIISNDGGERIIYPWFAQRLRARVSLADQLHTADVTVYIFDTIPCNLKVAARWTIEDASKFINKNSSARQDNESEESAALNMMKVWLKNLTAAISLAASQESFQSSFLHMVAVEEHESQEGGLDIDGIDELKPRVAKLTRNLGKILQAELNAETLAYGVRVVGVQIPETGLDANVRSAILKTLSARLKVEQAKLDARATQIAEEQQIETDRKRHAMHTSELGLGTARNLEVLRQLAPKLHVSPEELFKIVLASTGRDAELDAPDPVAGELQPPSEEPREPDKLDES